MPLREESAHKCEKEALVLALYCIIISVVGLSVGICLLSSSPCPIPFSHEVLWNTLKQDNDLGVLHLQNRRKKVFFFHLKFSLHHKLTFPLLVSYIEIFNTWTQIFSLLTIFLFLTTTPNIFVLTPTNSSPLNPQNTLLIRFYLQPVLWLKYYARRQVPMQSWSYCFPRKREITRKPTIICISVPAAGDIHKPESPSGPGWRCLFLACVSCLCSCLFPWTEQK